ncbi:MAG: dihydropteroate synthase [Hydrogenophilaceae bacterium]|nr:dihydropteroate synthase [Hydrogenophilaceae bacterium]
MTFLCGRFRFDLTRPLVMGVVNVTPDSFSDGGRYLAAEQAIAHGLSLKEAGADILDIGGESTRPGAAAVPLQQEMDRVLPVIEGLRGCGAALSVDTSKPELMRAAIAAGVDLVNDVCALTEPGALAAVADSEVGLCLMHMQGQPRTMQANPQYGDVVAEVAAYLEQRVAEAQAVGVAHERILVDPGFGFGKALSHNLALLQGLAKITNIAPVLVGLSRKSMLGLITGRPVDERLAASLAAMLAAVARGAAVVRVHDVKETVDALKVWAAIEEEQNG